MRRCLVLALAGWWVGQLASLNAQPAATNRVLDLEAPKGGVPATPQTDTNRLDRSRPGQADFWAFSRPKGGLSLSGRAVALDDTTPHDSLVLQLINADGTNIAGTALSDKQGNFQFAHLKAGRFRLRGYAGSQWVTNGTLVDLTNGSAKVDFRLARFKRGTARGYSASDGLAGNNVLAIYPAPDGSVWFGTLGGASHFDGKDFLNLTTAQGLLDDRVTSIVQDRNGAVWFGTFKGISRYDPATVGAKFTNFTLGITNQDWGVRGILQLRDGRILASTANGMFWFDGKDFRQLETPAELKDPWEMARDAQGVVWLATWRSGLWRYDGARLTRVRLEELASPAVQTRFPAVAPDGSVWVSLRPHGLAHYVPPATGSGQAAMTLLTPADGLPDAAAQGICVSADGMLWAGFQPNILTRFDGRGVVHFTPSDGLRENSYVLCVGGSADGLVWLGGGNGVCCLDPESLAVINSIDGMPAKGFGRIKVGSDGALWLAWGLPAYPALTAGLWRFDGHTFAPYRGKPEDNSQRVFDFLETPDGSWWSGTLTGIARWDGKELRTFTTADGLAGNRALSIAAGPSNTLWFAFEYGGLSCYDGQRFRTYTTTNGLPVNHFLGVKADSSGAIWAGTANAGVVRWDGQKFEHLAVTNGAPDGEVYNIESGPDGSMWFNNGSGGVKRYDREKKQFVLYTRAQGQLPDDGVWCIWRDSKGLIWVGTAVGVTRFDGQTWSPLPDAGTGNVYDIAEDPRRGVYWFATDHGLVRYRPIKLEARGPRVSFQIDLGRPELGALPPISVGRLVNVKFKVIDLRTRPEGRRYRYQITEGRLSPAELKGDAWSPALGLSELSWSTNRTGAYTLAVQYIDRDLNYSRPTLATLEVVVPWHANPWVLAPGGGGIGLLALIALVATTRARQRRREAEQLREQMYQQEHRARLELERENGERRRAEAEARQAKQAADDANKAKSQFLANMSHELRTPLNAIIGYSEMLQEEAADLGQKQFVPDLEKIHGAGKHLLTLINDILDLSKIEAGKMTLYLESFDVAQVIQDVATTVQPLVARNGNRLEVDCPPDIGTLRADLTKVRQTLFNLLSNACKFTEKGTIRLAVGRGFRQALEPTEQGSAVPAGRETLSFTVTDTGLGMSPEQLSRLFQAFAQADASTTRKFGGTGLGLAISKQFCLLMGGDLAVESELGKGSTFTMTLPVEVQPVAPPVETKTSPVLPTAATAGPLVLVIDDDPAALDLLQRALAKDGFAVQTAASGAKGLELARSLKPAAITLDVMMPGLDGWAVLSRLKADPATADIPVVMMTIVDDKNLGFALGAAEYLTKPIDWERLAAVMNKYRPHVSTVTVLVVEDELAVREVLRRNLERQGWQVTEAENGRVGLERVAAQVPGVILLDLLMPEMDGFDFVRALRQRPDCQRLPVIVITAKDLTEEDRRRLNGQVTQILQKGAYSTAELIREIRRLLANTRSPASP
jgi:signal transduction histidine kinase/CheY-like chemotaxis protein/ligand-binding sensor domain-containing protein